MSYVSRPYYVTPNEDDHRQTPHFEMSTKPVLLMTATVNVRSTIRTARSDPEVRARDYHDAIAFFSRELPDYRIVFVENSGWEDAAGLSAEYPNVLGSTFRDPLADDARGKGYGELGILAQALTLDECRTKLIVKVTGRLIVRNIAALMRRCEPLQAELLVDLGRDLAYADSRLFAFSPRFGRDYLIPQRAKLDDARGHFFEHGLATASLRAIGDGLPWSLLPCSPLFAGHSGTSNARVEENAISVVRAEAKRRLKKWFFRR